MNTVIIGIAELPAAHILICLKAAIKQCLRICGSGAQAKRRQ